MAEHTSEKTTGNEGDEYRPLLSSRHKHASQSRSSRRSRALRRFCATVAWTSYITFSVTTLVGLYITRNSWWPMLNPDSSGLSATSLETCAWPHLEPHVGLLDVPPIGRDEFLARQETLAEALRDAGVDAFIAEPSASSAYYANISYSFDLSERPFLMILNKDGQFSYLVPKFEAGRIAGLEMVYNDKKVIEWREEESPYEVLAKATGFTKIMLDEHVRYMIAAGLEKAGIEVVPMSGTVQSLRAVKTDAEITILRGINTYTLELVTALQKCIRVGVTQEAVVAAGEALFTRAGVGKGYWAIVLFGEQAASPHGGAHGKTLQPGEYALIDIGSMLHSYNSDVTRTILPPGSQVSPQLERIWNIVKTAQLAAFKEMHSRNKCSAVDAASRKPMGHWFSQYYTHRLGHGLGLEMHEHPYLNGANNETLQAGMVASNEPVSFIAAFWAVTYCPDD